MKIFTQKQLVMFHKKSFLIILPIVFLLLSCGNKSTVSGDPSLGEIPKGAQEMAFETLFSSSQSGLKEPTQEVLYSEDGLKNVFAIINSKRKPGIPIPDINFDTHEVFVFSPGQVSHGVPSPKVQRMLQFENKIVVQLEPVEQNENGYATTVISEPCVIVAYKKTSLPVVVETTGMKN